MLQNCIDQWWKLGTRRQKESLWKNSPATYCCMKPNNHFLFLGCEAVVLEIWPQVISPPKSATLPTSLKSCKTFSFMESCLTGKLNIITRLTVIQIISILCICKSTCFLWNSSPISCTMLGHMSKHFRIFLCSPETPFHIQFVTARRSHHRICLCKVTNQKMILQNKTS